MLLSFKCPHCRSQFKTPLPRICPECNGDTNQKLSQCSNCGKVQIGMPEPCCNQPIFNGPKETHPMTNLEFMARYEKLKAHGLFSIAQEQLDAINAHGQIGITDLNDEQIIAFRHAVVQFIEIERVAVQAMDHELRARGLKVKEEQKSKDSSYVPPVQTQLDSMEKKLSKKGESAESIAKVKKAIMDLDFSDI